MEVTGSFNRTITWHVDGRPVASRRSSEDTVWLRAGEPGPRGRGYLWPVVLVFALARREASRRRRQQALRAELEADATTHHPAPAEMPGSDCEARRNGPAGGARRDP